MSSKNKNQPIQAGLFGAALSCPNVSGMPIIVEPMGGIEVLAPGSVYQPLLLSSKSDEVDVGPGKLDSNEEAFVRDLIRYLYPAGDHPKSDKTPLKWGSKDIWLKRNIEKNDQSFRLRVDDSDWFYPDFIVWILDHETKTQTFGFVDPKGLTIGAGGGWSDYKIVSTLYMPHVVERQLLASGQPVEFEGEVWNFRVRGVLASTSSLDSLSAQAKFKINDENGLSVFPDEGDFMRARIVFQKPGTRPYIEDVLRLLTQDSSVDEVLKLSAQVFDAQSYFIPVDELGHDLALRHAEHGQSESGFVDALLEDYLKPDVHGQYGKLASEKRRAKLMNYAKEGTLGFGAEKIADIRDHPKPCEELWKRMQGKK
ncbi:hypothetical protein GCM10027046_30570 [Uliginosibacterium flavum]|uniref:Uncharacterized protein n=1 Tax=Uliginosibacterium flavum TaxID=1396831 RepID=A0ABV2THB6_9RHOO